MNLLKKGIFALLITSLIVSCDDEYDVITPNEHSTGPGLTEITFSSFKATVGPDENGFEDGVEGATVIISNPPLRPMIDEDTDSTADQLPLSARQAELPAQIARYRVRNYPPDAICWNH